MRNLRENCENTCGEIFVIFLNFSRVHNIANNNNQKGDQGIRGYYFYENFRINAVPGTNVAYTGIFNNYPLRQFPTFQRNKSTTKFCC